MSESTKPEKQTLIEEGTEFKGVVKSVCPVVVNGRIEGELTAPRLDVTTSGSVVGSIKADHLESRGKLSGNIDAGSLVLSGAVGEKTVIKAKNLEVKLAPENGRMQVTFGECTLDVGDEPAVARRDSKAPAASKADSSAKHQSADAKSADAPASGGRAGATHSKPPGAKSNGAGDSVRPGS